MSVSEPGAVSYGEVCEARLLSDKFLLHSATFFKFINKKKI